MVAEPGKADCRWCVIRRESWEARRVEIAKIRNARDNQCSVNSKTNRGQESGGDKSLWILSLDEVPGLSCRRLAAAQPRRRIAKKLAIESVGENDWPGPKSSIHFQFYYCRCLRKSI